MSELAKLRAEIDAVDAQILEKLSERIELVEKVGAFKSGQVAAGVDTTRSFSRPSREADLIRSLLDKRHPAYDKRAITGIWRQIIAMSLNHEQPISVVAHTTSMDNANFWMAREYFGAFTRIRPVESIPTILDALAVGHATVAIVDLKVQAKPWWIQLVENPAYADLKVCTRIPFYEDSPTQRSALAIANVAIEPSQEDVSLWVIHTDALPRLEKDLSADTRYSIVGTHDRWALLSVPGFAATDESISPLLSMAGPHVITHAFIGAYPTPI